MARASGLSQGAISSYENRTRQATGGIFALARALNVNPEWLHSGQGTMEPALALDVLTQPRLREGAPLATPSAWPFATISPEEYWSLDPQQRTLIEATLTALVAALRGRSQDRC